MEQEAYREDAIHTLTGTGYQADEWREVFAKEGKHVISDWAMQAIRDSEYDIKHRFAQGKRYKVRLLFTRDIHEVQLRRIEEMNKLAARLSGKRGTVGLKAELVFLLRQHFTNDDLRSLNVTRIVVPHRPLPAYDGELCWLRVDGFDMTSNVGAENATPGHAWDDRTALAYLV